MPRRRVSNFLYGNLTYKIRSALFNVYNGLGFGHKEIVYKRALAQEFNKQGVPCQIEKPLGVFYGGKKVGIYQPDFVVDNKILIEVKALQFIPRTSEAQLTYYLRCI